MQSLDMKKLLCENEMNLTEVFILNMVKQKAAKTLESEGTVTPWAAGSTSLRAPTCIYWLQEKKNPYLVHIP